MPNYEARIIRGAGLLNQVFPLYCDDDASALRQANLFVAFHDVQVWRDNAIIGTLHCRQCDTASPTSNVISFYGH
jgi:hypothetical protein